MKYLINALLWIVQKIVGCGGRCSPVLIAFLGVCVGCSSSQSYQEGQVLSLGVFAPYDGNIYGANIVNFFSGCQVQAMSNQTFTVQRTASSSNSYVWGAAQTNEKTETKVVFDK